MKYTIFALLFALTFGCKQAQEKQSAPEITAQDIAYALQMQKWTINIPEDCSSEDRLGLVAVFKNDSKIIRTLSIEPGKTVSLLIWRDQESDQFNYHSICNGSGSFGELGLEMKTGSFCGGMNNQKICSVGDEILQGHTGEEGFHIELCLTKK